MKVIVLVVTLFYFGPDTPPKTAAFVTPSPEACAQIASDAQTQIPAADQTVRDVEVSCMEVLQKDNT